MNKRDLKELTLKGPTVTRQVLDSLAVLLLGNRLYTKKLLHICRLMKKARVKDVLMEKRTSNIYSSLV